MQLLIQCSNGEIVLGLGVHGKLLAESETLDFEICDFQEQLKQMLLLERVHLSALTSIACDIGPGRRAATRAAIAFANGLAFSTQLPVVGMSAFSIVGATVEAQTGCQSLILRQASQGKMSWGIVKQGQVLSEGISELDTLEAELPDLMEDTVVLGGDVGQADLPSWLCGYPQININQSSMQCFARLAARFSPASVVQHPLVAAHAA